MRKAVTGLAIGASVAALVSLAIAIGPTLAAATLPQVTIDIDRLGSGPVPEVPWLQGKLINSGGVRTPVSGGGMAFVPISKGFVVRQADKMFFVRSQTGTKKGLSTCRLGDPVVTTDRETFSYVEITRSGKNLVSTMRVGTGDGRIDDSNVGTVAKLPYRQIGTMADGYAVMDGIGGDISAEFNGLFAADGVTWADTLGTTASSRSNVASLVMGRDSQNMCVTTFSFDTTRWERTKLWESCAIFPVSFSPTARYAIAAPSTSKYDKKLLFVVDARTGKKLLRINTELSRRIVWENNETFLIDAWKGKRMSLVRCTVGGSCKRATTVRPSDPAATQPAFLLPNLN